MMPVPQSDSAAEPDWAHGLTHPERRVRAAAVQLARGSGAASYHVFLSRLRIDAANWPLRLAQLWIQLPDTGRDAETPPFAPGDMLMCCQALAELAGEPTGQLEAVRLLEIALGDVRVKEGGAEVFIGYRGNAAEQVDAALKARLAERVARPVPQRRPGARPRIGAAVGHARRRPG